MGYFDSDFKGKVASNKEQQKKTPKATKTHATVATGKVKLLEGATSRELKDFNSGAAKARAEAAAKARAEAGRVMKERSDVIAKRPSFLANDLGPQSRPLPPKTEINAPSGAPNAWELVNGKLMPGSDVAGPQFNKWANDIGAGINATPKQGSYMINPPGKDGNPVDLNRPGMSAAGDATLQEDTNLREKQKLDLKAQLDARRAARSAGLVGKMKVEQMSQKEYDALDHEGKMAIQYNGMLQQSSSKDNQLLGLDKNKDGLVSVAEAGDEAKNKKGYTKAYERIFGKPREGEEMTYAPSTVGFLNKLNLRDPDGSLKEYLSKEGAGYINDDDLKNKYTTKGSEAVTAQGYLDPRAEWAKLRTEKMSILADAVEKAKLVRDGLKLNVSMENLSETQRSGIVDQMSNSLTGEEASQMLGLLGQAGMLDPKEGSNMFDAVTPGSAKRLDHLNGFYGIVTQDQRYLRGEITNDTLLDLERMGPALKDEGIKPADWLALVKNKQGLGGEKTANSVIGNPQPQEQK